MARSEGMSSAKGRVPFQSPAVPEQRLDILSFTVDRIHKMPASRSSTSTQAPAPRSHLPALVRCRL